MYVFSRYHDHSTSSHSGCVYSTLFKSLKSDDPQDVDMGKVAVKSKVSRVLSQLYDNAFLNRLRTISPFLPKLRCRDEHKN